MAWMTNCRDIAKFFNLYIRLTPQTVVSFIILDIISCLGFGYSHYDHLTQRLGKDSTTRLSG
jgi:hypothetical protein